MAMSTLREALAAAMVRKQWKPFKPMQTARGEDKVDVDLHKRVSALEREYSRRGLVRRQTRRVAYAGGLIGVGALWGKALFGAAWSGLAHLISWLADAAA